MSRRFFYSKEEFEAQYNDYIQQGKTPAQALQLVRANEAEDRKEYEGWLDGQNDRHDYWEE